MVRTFNGDFNLVALADKLLNSNRYQYQSLNIVILYGRDFLRVTTLDFTM